jgi:hypothetical protein
MIGPDHASPAAFLVRSEVAVPSIHDCAILAQDVYDRTGNAQAMDARWVRRDPQNWGNGFAAGTYSKGADTVIALRGTETDDSRDLISDAMMAPLARPGAAQSTLEGLLRTYHVSGSNLIAATAPLLVEALMQSTVIRAVIAVRANQVPGEQVQRALQYFDSCATRPTMVTGHSLGGALAQIVSQQRNVPCVAFNSPHMGDLGASTGADGARVDGMVPMSSQTLLQVNADLDPLSMATAAVGNLAHGRVITVKLPPFHAAPTRHSVDVPLWASLLAPVAAAMYDGYQTASAELSFHRELMQYLGEIMLYGHSMANLCATIARDGRYAVMLSPASPVARGHQHNAQVRHVQPRRH